MTYIFLAMRFLKGVPWQVYAAIGAALIVWFAYNRGFDARDETAKAEMAALEAEYRAAQADARRVNIAAREAAEARYRDLANRSEANALEARQTAVSAADRYIYRNRVQPCPVAGGGSATATPAASDSAHVPESLPADTLVSISGDDVRACAAVTAYALQARDWALSLER
jgi:hypothetical protein